MEKIKLYIHDAYDELVNKVSWPTWKELQQYAVVVLVAAIIISLIVWLMDLVSLNVVQKVIYKFLIPK